MKGLSRIRHFLRNRYQRWIDRRVRVDSECRLDHRRLFIFPSKAGFGFIVLAAATWLLATNFENNLAFMLCFCLLYTYPSPRDNIANLVFRLIL